MEKLIAETRKELPFVTITAPDFLSKMSTTFRLASKVPCVGISLWISINCSPWST